MIKPTNIMWFQRSQQEPDRVMSLALTPEQASTILEAETFVDSIYVPLRRAKVRSLYIIASRIIFRTVYRFSSRPGKKQNK